MKNSLQKDSNMSNLTESKLAALLKNSKAIMNKVEENNFKRGNIDPTLLINESEMVERPFEGNNTMEINQPISKTINSTQKFKNLSNTKLPKQIVDAMVNNPIDIPETPFHTFEVSESLVKELNSMDEDYDEKPVNYNNYNTTKRINETKNTNSTDIREMIKEEISKALPKIIAEYFDKRVISEQIQVKVGDTLFSGNLKPLPSKQTKK